MSEDHDRRNCLCDACVTWRFDHSREGQRIQSTRQSRGRGRRSGPPVAKNPANQAYIDEAWRKERERKEAERRRNHRGGFGDPVHGWLDGRPVTVAFGWGTREGETLLADGHVNLGTFKQHDNHNHYGKGDGRNNNVKDRLKYTGPDA